MPSSARTSLCSARRPAISKPRKLALVARAALGKLLGQIVMSCRSHEPKCMIPWSPAPAQLTMAYSVCRGITRTNAKNFYYAFLVLPKRKRQALSAVYAFMRRCDDIADDPSLSLEERRYKLDTWLAACTAPSRASPPTIQSCWR